MRSDPMYLEKRPNGFYYFRRAMPKALEPYLRQHDFFHSLKTRTRSEAIKLLAHALAMSTASLEQAEREHTKALSNPRMMPVNRKRSGKVEAEIQRARALKTRSFFDVPPVEITQLLQAWFCKERQSILSDFEAHYHHVTDEQRLERSAEAGTLWGNLTSDVEDHPLREIYVQRAADRLLSAAGISAPRTAFTVGSYQEFQNLVHTGAILLAQIECRLWEDGELVPNLTKPFPLFDAAASAPVAALHSFTSGHAKSITVDELIQRFENNHKRRNLEAKTKNEYGIIYRALREHFGAETAVRSISRDDFLRVRHTFEHLPTRATQRWPEKRLTEVVEIAKAEGLAAIHPKTYNKRIEAVSAIFNFAETEGLVDKNLAKGLGVPEPMGNNEGEKVFTMDQLNTIFSGSTYAEFLASKEARFTPKHPLRPCFYWAPLIALFSGMRENEILQLNEGDVRSQDEFHYFDVRLGEGKNLKTRQSQRQVPIHQELIRLGLLEYVANVRKAKHTALFPDAERGCDGRFSSWYQKHFARYLYAVGVKKGRSECFHSFRHTWKDGLSMARVEEDIRCKLGGWRGTSSAEGRYGGGAAILGRLNEDLQRVKFDGLDLSHHMPPASV